MMKTSALFGSKVLSVWGFVVRWPKTRTFRCRSFCAPTTMLEEMALLRSPNGWELKTITIVFQKLGFQETMFRLYPATYDLWFVLKNHWFLRNLVKPRAKKPNIHTTSSSRGGSSSSAQSIWTPKIHASVRVDPSRMGMNFNNTFD